MPCSQELQSFLKKVFRFILFYERDAVKLGEDRSEKDERILKRIKDLIFSKFETPQERWLLFCFLAVFSQRFEKEINEFLVKNYPRDVKVDELEKMVFIMLDINHLGHKFDTTIEEWKKIIKSTNNTSSAWIKEMIFLSMQIITSVHQNTFNLNVALRS